MRKLFLSLCLLASLAAPALAVQPDEILPDAALEARARALSAHLRCLVCQNQSIDDSDAPLARDLRLIIRERLTAGDTDDQVMEFLVGRYGDFVLLKPPFKPVTYLLWIGPFLVLLSGGLYLLLRRRPATLAEEAPISPQEAESLKKWL